MITTKHWSPQAHPWWSSKDCRSWNPDHRSNASHTKYISHRRWSNPWSPQNTGHPKFIRDEAAKTVARESTVKIPPISKPIVTTSSFVKSQQVHLLSNHHRSRRWSNPWSPQNTGHPKFIRDEAAKTVARESTVKYRRSLLIFPWVNFLCYDYTAKT